MFWRPVGEGRVGTPHLHLRREHIRVRNHVGAHNPGNGRAPAKNSGRCTESTCKRHRRKEWGGGGGRPPAVPGVSFGTAAKRPLTHCTPRTPGSPVPGPHDGDLLLSSNNGLGGLQRGRGSAAAAAAGEPEGAGEQLYGCCVGRTPTPQPCRDTHHTTAPRHTALRMQTNTTYTHGHTARWGAGRRRVKGARCHVCTHVLPTARGG
jgi:hypothetical protein